MTKKQTKKSRQAATELVRASVSTKRQGKWTERLSPGERTYITRVLAAMKETPGAAPYVVARNLKKELGLTVCVGTVAKTLKELLADA